MNPGHVGPPRVELLLVPDCPSHAPLERMVRDLLAELAPAASFSTILVESADQARELRFPGSPTLRINGQDLEPEAEQSLNYGLG